MNEALVPNVLSWFVKYLGNNNVPENAISGGIEIAACVAVPGTKFQSLGLTDVVIEVMNIAVPATRAVLLIGPPRSVQIIPATIAANNMFPPGMSPIKMIPLYIHNVTSPRIGPKIYLPTIITDNPISNGHSIKSHKPLNVLLTLIFLICKAMCPTKNPITIAPKNPVPNGVPSIESPKKFPSFINHPPRNAGANVILPAIEYAIPAAITG